MPAIIPTNRCNLRCKHCLRKSYVGDIDIDVVGRFLSHMEGRGITMITLTGGEPTAYPEFERLLHMLRHFRVCLVTNAQDGIETVINHRSIFQTVSISIEGPERQSNDRVRGEGSLDGALYAVKEYRKYGLSLQLNVTLHEGNVHHLSNMVSFAEQNGFGTVKFTWLAENIKSRRNGLSLDDREIQDVYRKVAMLDGKIRVFMSESALPNRSPRWPESCPILHGEDALTPSGEIALCCGLYNLDFASAGPSPLLGNLKTQPYAEIEKTRKALISTLLEDRARAIRSPYVCRHCMSFFYEIQDP